MYAYWTFCVPFCLNFAEAFKIYATEKPEYAQLFTTYRQQSSSSSEPKQAQHTNGGTNQVSDKKMD